jgi:hypothetical protein
VTQRNVVYHAKRYPGRWRLIKVPMDVYLVGISSLLPSRDLTLEAVVIVFRRNFPVIWWSREWEMGAGREIVHREGMFSAE